MFRIFLALTVFMAAPIVHAAAPAVPPDAVAESSAWRSKVAETLPLLGHRNWILIVDSAYPLQVSPGVETIETGSNLIGVLRYVLGEIDHSEHVRPDIYMDAELPFVPEEDAPGAGQYRANIGDALRAYQVQSLPHDKIIGNIDEAGKTFRVLTLKTNMTIPYSSVFIRLNCRYWSDDAEARLRAKMKAGSR